jgi:hypothetical protein
MWLTVCFLLFLNGINSFISSSEFWSIYLSQKIFSFDPSWKSVYLKPLFHLILSSVYLLNLNDFYHVYATKILFSLNGVIQFFLIYKILENVNSNRFRNFWLTIYMFFSPLYLANYDRIRSDQVAVTLFLMFLFLHFSKSSSTTPNRFLLAILIPAIAYKHVYFSLMMLFFLPVNEIILNYQSIGANKKILLNLLFLTVLVWMVYFALPAFEYFLQSYDGYQKSFYNVLEWVKTEWFFIYCSIIPYFFTDFRAFLRTKNLIQFQYLQIFLIFLLFLYPQKYNFFIASLLPVFYLSGVFFINYAIESKIISSITLILTLFAFSSFNIKLAHKTSHFLTFNNPQLITIERLSNIITKNHLTYLDGTGILPRAKNVGCFVSPDDDSSNQACRNILISEIPDAIIVTNRLMSLNFSFDSIKDSVYVSAGPNFLLKKKYLPLLKNETTEWPPPSLLFSSEQIY